jgi:HEAT repeat protein/Na+/melibiose symporter-like transporter
VDATINIEATTDLEPTTAEKIAKLPWSLFGAAANTVFAQFTVFGSVFVLFLDSLGLSKSAIGFLLSLFPFFGLTALFTAPAVARFGFKRTFLTFWTARKIVVAGLLLTPWVLARFGTATASAYVAVIVAGFAICRAIGETGSYPWIQEYIPASVRGKYSANENTVGTLANLAAVGVAGYVVGRSAGMTGFMVLIAAGVVFGLVTVWGYSHLPGGAPVHGANDTRGLPQRLSKPARDRDFRRFLIGASLMTLAWGPIGSFLPLFMRDQVGLSAQQVVWLQAGTFIGGLLSGYAWGWAADRYGSRPVMLSGMYLLAGLPIFWLLMPRHSGLSLPIALGAALLLGLVTLGWSIGSTRQLFVNLVPPQHKSDYMAMNYAWMGLVGGLSQVLGGRLIDLTKGLSGQVFFVALDPYTLLFAAGIVLPVAGALLLSSIRADSHYSVPEFAGMFFQGNPLLAAEMVIRYGRARDEQATVSLTERLGQAKSLLTVEELLEGLADPRFNVRFEAILAMARMPADSRVIEALAEIASAGDPALSVVAAWALGRIGDVRAIPALRPGLDSQYRSVRAHTVRALGTLQDEELGAGLLERFRTEPDHGIRMAYASALGKLQIVEAVEPLLEFLRTRQETGARQELALILARLIGGEEHFIQLWRQARAQAGTGLSQAATALQRRAHRLPILLAGEERHLGLCAEAFARGELDEGAEHLKALIDCLSFEQFDRARAAVLRECAARLAEHRAARQEYVLLALHALSSDLHPALLSPPHRNVA